MGRGTQQAGLGTMGELEVGHRRFGGGERAKEGRLGETGTRFLRGNSGSKLASMGGHSGEGLGGENRRAMAATIWSGSGSRFPRDGHRMPDSRWQE